MNTYKLHFFLSDRACIHKDTKRNKFLLSYVLHLYSTEESRRGREREGENEKDNFNTQNNEN